MRARQSLPFAGAGLPVLPVLETNENGICTTKYVDFSKVELPSVETTDLRSCLDAGVNLKQVNTKIFSQSEVITDLSVEPKDVDNDDDKETK